MLAPQPFFRARGTPFSVLQRIRALTRLGHTVDLVTYPFGEDVAVPGLTIHRAEHVPFVRDVAIGPSVAKLALDLALLRKALPLLRSGSFDLLHTHEEAGIAGAWLARRFGLPHLYDMHSSLPEQFRNFGRYDWAPVTGIFRRLERYTLGGSDLVITVCPALADHLERVGHTGPSAMIENTFGLPGTGIPSQELTAVRTELRLVDEPIVVYTGTLEPYQGIDLVLDAASIVRAALPEVRFLIVGGSADQVGELRERISSMGLKATVLLTGTVPPERIPTIHALSSVLVTARTRGVNTPLKIYEYLRAGRPIVATAIPSHTQVLDDTIAELVAATAAGIAGGLLRVLTDPDRAESLAREARRFSEDRYGDERYLSRLADLLGRLSPRRPGRGDDPTPATRVTSELNR